MFAPQLCTSDAFLSLTLWHKQMPSYSSAPPSTAGYLRQEATVSIQPMLHTCTYAHLTAAARSHLKPSTFFGCWYDTVASRWRCTTCLSQHSSIRCDFRSSPEGDSATWWTLSSKRCHVSPVSGRVLQNRPPLKSKHQICLKHNEHLSDTCCAPIHQQSVT